MKTIASLSGGWIADADTIQCDGHTLLVYPTAYGALPLKHCLPELMNFKDIVEDMSRCTNDIFILPERENQ